MSETPEKTREGGFMGSLPRVTIAAAVVVLMLALGAILFPGGRGGDSGGVLLVLDSPVNDARRLELFDALARFLEEQTGRPLDLVRVTSGTAFKARATEGADFLLCPDLLALDLDHGTYGPLAAGKRSMPTNLRPRGVLVYRHAVGFQEEPWLTAPDRTVFGDSLSLVTMGQVGGGAPAGCAFGPDPYDHGPVLHALRLGAFDHALVRQWDADGFFAAGLLDETVFGVEMRTPPVPDIVIMASRLTPMVDRVRWAEGLALVGQEGQPVTEGARRLEAGLVELGLSGFNLLLEPDFERVRRLFAGDWPLNAD